MDKLLKYLMLLLVTTLSLTFTACGGDDDKDEPNVPPNVESEWRYLGCNTSSSGFSFRCGRARIVFKYADNFSKLLATTDSYANVRIVPLGQVESIEDISKIPSNGWLNLLPNSQREFILNEEDAFIVEVSNDGTISYCSIFLTYSKNASNEIMGVIATYYNKL